MSRLSSRSSPGGITSYSRSCESCLFLLRHELKPRFRAKHAKTETRANALEREILLEFEILQDKASLLSKTSEDMLEAFENFVTANAQQCRRSDWRRNGSHFDPNADLERLSNKLVGGSSTVSKYVEKMRGKLLDIVKSIENAVHHAERKASRDKILRVFARALKIINLGAGAGASIAQVIPTAEALAAAAALGGIGALTGSAAKAVDKLRKGILTGITIIWLVIVDT